MNIKLRRRVSPELEFGVVATLVVVCGETLPLLLHLHLLHLLHHHGVHLLLHPAHGICIEIKRLLLLIWRYLAHKWVWLLTHHVCSELLLLLRIATWGSHHIGVLHPCSSSHESVLLLLRPHVVCLVIIAHVLLRISPLELWLLLLLLLVHSRRNDLDWTLSHITVECLESVEV